MFVVGGGLGFVGFGAGVGFGSGEGFGSGVATCVVVGFGLVSPESSYIDVGLEIAMMFLLFGEQVL